MSTAADPPNDAAPPTAIPSGVVTIRAAGELVYARDAEAVLAPGTSTPPGTAITVDLTAVTHLSMEAVVPLLSLARQSATEGRTMSILGSVAVHRKLTTLGLDTLLPLHPPPC